MKNRIGSKFARFMAVFLLLVTVLPAQDYQELHEKGKQHYHANEDMEALKTYNRILEEYPEDADALLFRGRLLARMGMYDAAEKDLLRVLKKAPDYLDAYYALASLYYWQEDLENARLILSRWLRRDLENPDVYILSARVAIAGRKYAAARTFLEEASAYDADPEIIGSLLRIINSPADKYDRTAGIQYEYLAVDSDRSDWQHIRAFFTRDFDNVIITGELSRYHRNELTDHSAVADIYFQLWKKAYMNTRIQAGMNGTFLPRADLTIELFQAVGTRQEPAAGYRLMHFDSLAVHIPSFAWAAYPGEWYIRNKVSMIVRDGISWQNQLTLRYFFDNVDNYLQLMNVLGTDFNVLTNEWMQSISLALSGSYCLTEHILFTAGLSWTRDEFFLQRFGGSAGLSYRW